MKKLVLLVVVIGLVVFGLKYFKGLDQQAFLDNSVTRVEEMFENMKSDSTAYQQEAIAYWYVGHPMVPGETIVAAFERFMREKNVRYPIKEYEIIDAQLFNGEDVVSRRVEIVCKVDGQTLNITAYFKQPLEWTS